MKQDQTICIFIVLKSLNLRSHLIKASPVMFYLCTFDLNLKCKKYSLLNQTNLAQTSSDKLISFQTVEKLFRLLYKFACKVIL